MGQDYRGNLLSILHIYVHVEIFVTKKKTTTIKIFKIQIINSWPQHYSFFLLVRSATCQRMIARSSLDPTFHPT